MATCGFCNDSTWVPTVLEDGNSAVKRCECVENGRVDRYLRSSKIPDTFAESELSNYDTGFPGASQLQKAASFMVNQFSRRSVAETRSSGIALVGGCGVGKTHLAVGLLKHLIREQRRRGMFYSAERLVEVIKGTFDRDDMSEWDVVEPVVAADILVLDDLGRGRITSYVQDKLAYILNERYDRKLTTVITTNYPFAEPTRGLEDADFTKQKKQTLGDCVGERAFSRLQEMCLVIPVSGPDFRATVRKASTRNMI